MERKAIEENVEGFYKAWLANDPNQRLAYFSEGASIKYAGSDATSEFPKSTNSKASPREAVEKVAAVWK